jgi:GTP-binding protein SAR1
MHTFISTCASGLSSKSGKILFLGLDNAGKTTLLHKLKDDRLTVHEPTLHPNSEVLEVGNIHFTTFDLGGHESARKLWKDYFPEVDGIVYIVDAADRARFPEAKKELDELLTDESLSGVPFVVLGNKIDIPSAASEPELRGCLGMHNTYGKEIRGSVDPNNNIRPMELFMCSVVKTTGYADGFRWLAQFI